MWGKAVSKRARDDESVTDLIDERGLPKDDLRFEVLGTLDEASSALGLVRATNTSSETRDLILEIQTDLCWMMSELSVVSDEKRFETHITVERLGALEKAYRDLTATRPEIDRELKAARTRSSSFVPPGQNTVGALMHLACSIIRRAERHLKLLDAAARLHNPRIIPYVNRLSTLVYAMARVEEAGSRPTR
jgi:cob(I)alamin adenosyltransferase